MRKRLLGLTLVAAMAFSLTGYRSAEPTATEAPTTNAAPATTTAGGGETDAAEGAKTEAPAADFKIGITMGTASQGDEEVTQTSRAKEKYDDIIITSTYPDDFSTETETVISDTVAVASDPAVKAIVRYQAIPGTAAATDKVRETRPGMIFIADTPGEDPDVINPKVDIVLRIDEPGCGIVIFPQVRAQGAKAMIHYSFPHHMSYVPIVARHENLGKHYAESGIELVDVTAPDPTGNSGITGTQQFILGDVPRQIEKYGKDTVFFIASCGMQEPLIRSVFEQGAIYSLQCCPPPFHAFPTMPNINMTKHGANTDYMLDQLQTKVDKASANRRVSTWGAPYNMLFVEAGVEYAKKVLGRQTNSVVLDNQVLCDALQECAGEIQIAIGNYVGDSNDTKDNHYLIMVDFVTFE